MALYGRDTVLKKGGTTPPMEQRSFVTQRRSTAQLPHVEGMGHDEVAELHEAFLQFDKDGDGTIDAAELGTALRSLGQNPSKEEVEKMIKDLDNDGSGSIEFEEFAKMMGQKNSKTSEQELMEAFRFFDQNKNGVLLKDVRRAPRKRYQALGTDARIGIA